MFGALLIFVSQVAKIGIRSWNKEEKSGFYKNIYFSEYVREWR